MGLLTVDLTGFGLVMSAESNPIEALDGHTRMLAHRGGRSFGRKHPSERGCRVDKESGKEQGQELASNLQERALESGTASEAAGQTY